MGSAAGAEQSRAHVGSEKDDPGTNRLELVVDSTVQIQVEVPQEGDVEHGALDAPVDGAFVGSAEGVAGSRLTAHGLFHGASSLPGHSIERQIGLGRVLEAGQVLPMGTKPGFVPQLAEDDVGGREIVVEVVEAFVE